LAAPFKGKAVKTRLLSRRWLHKRQHETLKKEAGTQKKKQKKNTQATVYKGTHTHTHRHTYKNRKAGKKAFMQL